MADPHEISLPEAKIMTTAYRDSAFFAENGYRKAVAFSKEAILRVLEQEESNGLRCYFALDKDKLITLILAAYDRSENDIIGEGRQFAEYGNPCPSMCSNDNDLNI